MNDGETASLTLQLGSPLSTEVGGLPYFFGCTPNSAFSHKMNRTIFFSYLDSDSPNNNLVNSSECDDVPVCGAYYMSYDDSEGGGNLAVITEAFYHPGEALGGGRVNVSYGYNNYQIGSVRSRFDSVFDLIGEMDDSKSVSTSASARHPTSLMAKLLRLAPFSSTDKTVVHSKVDFYYDSEGLVGQEVIKVNTTVADDFTKQIVNIRYRIDGSGDIIQVRDLPEGLPTSQIDVTYDENGQIIKACQDGCASFRETFVYDPSGRLTAFKTNGTEYKFKYHSGQIQTANFGADYGLFTFNY